jgi:hypothetical protein
MCTCSAVFIQKNKNNRSLSKWKIKVSRILLLEWKTNLWKWRYQISLALTYKMLLVPLTFFSVKSTMCQKYVYLEYHRVTRTLIRNVKVNGRPPRPGSDSIYVLLLAWRKLSLALAKSEFLKWSSMCPDLVVVFSSSTSQFSWNPVNKPNFF